MSSLKEKANELASKGRYGDTMLLHVNPAEVQGLASLVPGGKLPTNPDTGLPEAFFFLPFLGALGGMAGGLGALGGGMAAGMGAASAVPAIAAAAPTVAGGLGAAGAGAAGAAASALPAAASAALPSAATAAIPAAAETAAAALPAAGTAAAETAAAALPAATTAAETAAAAAPAAASSVAPEAAAALAMPDPARFGGAASGIGNVVGMPQGMTPFLPEAGMIHGVEGFAMPSALPAEGATVIAPEVPTVATSIPQAGDLALGIGPEPFAQAAAAPGVDVAGGVAAGGDAAAGGMGGAGQAVAGDAVSAGAFEGGGSAMTSAGTAAPAGAQGPMGGLGSMLGGMDLSQLAPLAMMMGRGGGGKKKKGEDKEVDDTYEGGDPVFPGEDYEAGIDPEWDYFPQYNNGGMVGGLGAMGPAPIEPMGGNPGGPQGMPGAGLEAMMPPGGMTGANPMMEKTMGPLPMAAQPEEPEPSAGDEELIAQTVEAIQGQHPNPDAVLRAFLQTFGEQALQDLIARVQGSAPQGAAPQGGGGPVKGPGDGMSDSIPAVIDGQQPAAISSGEYVVPADVVSGLGNGSTDAGVEQLEGMKNKVRKMRNGGKVQPPAINPNKVLPA